jgi:hypothetical protein
MLNDVVGESVRKDFAGEGWNRDSRGVSFENVAKMFKVTVASTN